MRYFNKYIKKYIWLFLLAVFLLTIEAICDLAQPTIMAQIIDVGIYNKDINYILSTGAIMIGITLLGAVFAVLRNIVSTNVSQRFATELRSDIFVKINQFSLRTIDKFSRASLITRTTNDVTQIQHFVHGMMRVFIKSPILCVGSFIIAMKLNFKLSLIILVAIIFIFIVIFSNMKIGNLFFKRVQKSTDKVNGQLRQYLSGVKIVKLFKREDYEINKFEKYNEELYTNSTKAIIRVALFRPTIEFILNIATIVILLIGARFVNLGTLKIGVIVAYINYMARILTSLVMIANLLNVFVRARASYERILEVLDNNEDTDTGDKKEDFVDGDIEFKDVCFSYIEDHMVLKNLSFNIKEGEKIGIIGETGSGKTALINLIAKLYKVDSGNISIGKNNINDINEQRLRDNIGLVFQRPSLFGKSIIENINLGNENISIEDVVEACKIADAHDFISNLENNYNEIISQGGKSLSGGQRQRLTIARALVKKPKILILDDCYSKVDISTENKLKKNINEYIKNNKSIIITISQKVSSIVDCDRIMVLDEGSIVGFDTHDNLLNNSPKYKEIYELQLIGKEEIK